MSFAFTKRVSSAPGSLQNENQQKDKNKSDESTCRPSPAGKRVPSKTADSETKPATQKHRSNAPRLRLKDSMDQIKCPAKQQASKLTSSQSVEGMDKIASPTTTTMLSSLKDMAHGNGSGRKSRGSMSPIKRVPPLEVANMANTSFENILGKATGDADSKLLDYSFRYLKEEVKNLLRQSVSKEDLIESLRERIKEAEKNFTEIRKKCIFLEDRNKVLEKKLVAANEKCDDISQDLAAANSYIAEAKKGSSGPNRMDLERKVGHLMSENGRLRYEMESMKRCTKTEQDVDRRTAEDLRAENKLLKQQKAELLDVVSKQTKLVNNLRRQLMHLKAGQIHQFTEEEIASAFETFS